MRVDPKTANKPAKSDPAPAPKPKAEFAAVLKEGAAQAQPQPARKPPAPPRPPALSPEAKPARPETPVEGRPRKPEEEALPTAPLELEPAPQRTPLSAPVEAPAPAGPVASTLPVERIADEVVLIARPDGSREIQAEVDSKVISDLRISVIQRGEKVEVRLLTDTQATRQQLEQALPQLSQALQARQLNPTLLQVLPRAHTPSVAFAGQAGASRRQSRERDGRERGRR